jgi:hypothetical protein
VRRDPESEREVAFAVNGDYLLLATREDLMAGALQRMAASKENTIEAEAWYSRSIASAGAAGDLRMVLNLEKIVPSPYFRSYWIQENVTEMKQYSSAICDLVCSGKEYREQRVLLKKAASPEGAVPEDKGAAAVADLLRLVPAGVVVYKAKANPSPEEAFGVLETKILAPHLGPTVADKLAPQVELGNGEAGGGSDLETMINQPPIQQSISSDASTGLRQLLTKNHVVAMLQTQTTAQSDDDIFMRMHCGIVLLGESDWDESMARTALTDFLRLGITTGQLGVEWRTNSGSADLDGLWSLAVAVRGRHLLISDHRELLTEMLTNMKQPARDKPAIYAAGFNHAQEREKFAKLAGELNKSSGSPQSGNRVDFFSGNITSLSSTLANFTSEKIVVRDEGNKVLQMATYEWGH